MCINYALLGFYLCHFSRSEDIKRWLKNINIRKKYSLTYNNAWPVIQRNRIKIKKKQYQKF